MTDQEKRLKKKNTRIGNKQGIVTIHHTNIKKEKRQ